MAPAPGRRTLVLSALAAAASGACAGTAAAVPPGSGRVPAAGRVRLALPAPGGPYPVGAHALHLVDRSRRDPWTGAPTRELMATVRYPARRTAGLPAAPYMLPGEAAGWTLLNSLTGIPAERVDWAGTRTASRLGAPAAPGPHPVVLYSPGAGDPRSWGTLLCEDLASRGHVVVMVDHTYDATAVQFPDGRVASTVLPAEFAAVVPDPEHPDPAKVATLLRKVLQVRVDDVRFVLDVLLDALPDGLRSAADLSRTGAFGQSAGGFTALQAMHDDPRIAAAANFDGVTAYVQDDDESGYLSSAAADGLDRPFLLVGKDGNTPATVPSWRALTRNSRGWKRALDIQGAEHATFTDAEALVPRLGRDLRLPRATVTANIGTVRPARALAIDRALVAGFFGRFLDGGAQGI
ncbi:alpha/beta hydrolase family protein, partial [Actinacidiphila yeochonensis]|uniref:alpha/beta hydrolase family protein n=1 Tax=Actinacidiphila yeochonensis TaxID=89050 RepID=UPI000562DEF6